MVSATAPELTVSFTLDTTSICEILLRYIRGQGFSDSVTSLDECENSFSIVDENSATKLGKVSIKLTKKKEASFFQDIKDLIQCEQQIEDVKYGTNEIEKVTLNCLETSSKSVVDLTKLSPHNDCTELEVDLSNKSSFFSKNDFNDIDHLSGSDALSRSVPPFEDLINSSASCKAEPTQSFNQFANTASPNSTPLDIPNQVLCNNESASNNGLDLLNSFFVEDQLHKCSKCPYETWSKKYLLQHHRNQHANLFVYCAYCGSSFRQKYLLRRHYVSKHGINEETAQRLIDSIDYISHDDNNGYDAEHPKPAKSPKTFHSDLVEFLNVLQADRTRGAGVEQNASNDSKACSSGCDTSSILRTRLSATGSESSVCEICMLSVCSKNELESHYRKEHKMDPDTIKALNSASKYIKSETSRASIESCSGSHHDTSAARVFRVPNLVPHEESSLSTLGSNSQKTANLPERSEKWKDEPDSMTCFEISKNS